MHVFFSVGEPSGDAYASCLMRALRTARTEVRFSGFGGPRMQAEGCHLLYPLTELALMGLTAIVPHLRHFFRLLKQAEQFFAEDRPDAVVLLDYPGFNWWVARRAKAAGIPVFYYFPPQLWAWAPWRIRRMRRHVDHVLTTLPFEAPWYAARGIRVRDVGHPIFDDIRQQVLDTAWIDHFRSRQQPLVALLPGSRDQEVHYNWPLMLDVVARLVEAEPRVQFLVACYKPAYQEWCERQLRESKRTLPIQFFVGKTSEIIEVADCSLMVSGSTSLEMLARATPTVVIYRCGWIFYAIARLLVTCASMTLPNLIAGRRVMPEFLSVGPRHATTDQVVPILKRWITDADARQVAVDELRSLRRDVMRTGAAARAAEAILQAVSVAVRRAA